MIYNAIFVIYLYYIELVIIPVEVIRLLGTVRLLLGKEPCLLQRCGLSLVSSAPKK